MRLARHALLLLLALGLARGTAAGRSWRVSQDGSGDFTSIQTAIEAAAGGDDIAVGPGTYHERLFLTGPPRRIWSIQGPKQTFIDADSSGSVVTMMYVSGAGTSLEGFTLQKGTGTRLDRAALLGNPSLASEELWPQDMSVRSRIWREMEGGSDTATKSGNRQERLGGGVLLLAASPTLREVFLDRDGADVGGGLYALMSAPSVSQCRFQGNVAGWGAGATMEHCDRAAFNECLWDENYGAAGGGLALLYASCRVSDCLFSRNQAGEGGALQVQGRGPTPVILQRTLLWRNSAGDGSGVYTAEGSLIISSCTFTGNGLAGAGGSVLFFQEGSAVVMTQTILAQNGSGEFLQTIDSSVSTSCCDFYNPTGIAPGYPREATNFSLDPLFCDPSMGDFHLQQASSCAQDNSPRHCGGVGAFPQGCTQAAGGILVR